MDWSEFIEDLCEKCSTRLHFGKENRKTAARIADTEGPWRLPSSPIVEKNMCMFYVAVVAVDIVEDDAEDDAEDDDDDDVDDDEEGWGEEGEEGHAQRKI